MHELFLLSPQVAPVFEKPQARMREAAAATSSGAAAAESALPPETVTIPDYEERFEAGAVADLEDGHNTA
eukprot:1404268-Rhodomonas_salina.2